MCWPRRSTIMGEDRFHKRRDALLGPVPAWWFAPWHYVCRLVLYFGGIVGLAAWFNAGPLALFAPFFPVVVKVGSFGLMLVAALFGMVTFGLALLYQRRVMRLARRIRAATPRHDC